MLNFGCDFVVFWVVDQHFLLIFCFLALQTSSIWLGFPLCEHWGWSGEEVLTKFPTTKHLQLILNNYVLLVQEQSALNLFLFKYCYIYIYFFLKIVCPFKKKKKFYYPTHIFFI